MCDGSRLSRGISSIFSVSMGSTGSYSGAITVCSAPAHLFLYSRSVITDAQFFFTPMHTHVRPKSTCDWRLLTGDFLIGFFALLCGFTLDPIENDQRPPNPHKKWLARSPGRCNRVNPANRWTITKSFRLSGTTSDSLKGCILGLARMSRLGF